MFLTASDDGPADGEDASNNRCCCSAPAQIKEPLHKFEFLLHLSSKMESNPDAKWALATLLMTAPSRFSCSTHYGRLLHAEKRTKKEQVFVSFFPPYRCVVFFFFLLFFRNLWGKRVWASECLVQETLPVLQQYTTQLLKHVDEAANSHQIFIRPEEAEQLVVEDETGVNITFYKGSCLLFIAAHRFLFSCDLKTAWPFDPTNKIVWNPKGGFKQ